MYVILTFWQFLFGIRITMNLKPFSVQVKPTIGKMLLRSIRLELSLKGKFVSLEISAR